MSIIIEELELEHELEKANKQAELCIDELILGYLNVVARLPDYIVQENVLQDLEKLGYSKDWTADALRDFEVVHALSSIGSNNEN